MQSTSEPMRGNSFSLLTATCHLQAGKQQPTQSSPAKVTELTPAEAARESGNEAFKKGNLQKASHTAPLHKAQIRHCPS